MPADLDPLAVLRRTDPATAWTVPAAPPLDLLAALPVAARPGPGRPGRLGVLAAALLLVALLAGAAIVVATDPDRDSAPATAPDEGILPRLPLTVREPASPALLALAGRVERDLTVVPAASVAYARTVSRDQSITVDGDETTITSTATQEEIWTEPNGTSRHRHGPGPSIRDGAVVQVDPSLAPPEGDLIVGDPSIAEPLARPQGADAVLADLHVGRGGQPEPYAALERLTEILGRQPLLAADRAALYRALATIEGIEHRGSVVDRAGRDGIAFTYESDVSGARGELIVIVAPDSGELLGSERVRLESARFIPITEPVVTGYQVVLGVASVGAVGERPRR